MLTCQLSSFVFDSLPFSFWYASFLPLSTSWRPLLFSFCFFFGFVFYIDGVLGGFGCDELSRYCCGSVERPPSGRRNFFNPALLFIVYCVIFFFSCWPIRDFPLELRANIRTSEIARKTNVKPKPTMDKVIAASYGQIKAFLC